MTPLDSRRALITYALVSESLDKSNDFLMGLAPIFAAIAEERDGQIFAPKLFAADAEKFFGLAIPEEVADFLAPRLQKDGVLTRPQANVVTYVWRKSTGSSPGKSAISSKIDQIVDELVGFALQFPSVSGKTFTRDELQDGLFEWILSEDRHVRSAMSALGYDRADELPPFLQETIYIAASFIKSIEQRTDGIVETLGEIANAVVVSEALLGVINPPAENVAGTDLTVNLDAPLALDLIGTSGKEKKSYAEEIFSGLKKFGCNVAIFSHSFDELRDNLKAVISSI